MKEVLKAGQDDFFMAGFFDYEI
ncbi:uncharacterized protein METZ01_LOCUS359131 [marine metagenome]|uniref:Uncharacterized protein n=1 Tax=marine metagenome TaxID=408172 RepID=A0A382SAM5_9ZZZZ